jgi:hypothetical protein
VILEHRGLAARSPWRHQWGVRSVRCRRTRHDRLPEAGRLLAPASGAMARGKARRVQEFGRLLATPAQLPQKPPRVAEMIPSVLGESGDATRCQRPRVAPRCSWTALDPALDGWEFERLPPWSAPGVLQSHAAAKFEVLFSSAHRLAMDTDLWRNLQALVQHLGRVPSSLYQRIESPTSTTGLPVPGSRAQGDAGGHCITPNGEGMTVDGSRLTASRTRLTPLNAKATTTGPNKIVIRPLTWPRLTAALGS